MDIVKTLFTNNDSSSEAEGIFYITTPGLVGNMRLFLVNKFILSWSNYA